MIAEDYVSFETAKLLKEKGFNEECSYWYYDDANEPNRLCDTWRKDSWLEVSNGHISFIHAPTLQMAMKWLRDNYGFHIAVGPLSFEKLTGKAESYIFNYWFNGEYHIPYQEKHPEYHKLFAKTWEKYEEACEAAIKYCLENLA